MKTQNHKTVRGKLLFYLEGNLTKAEHQQVEKHLHECNECAEYFNDLKASFAMLESHKFEKTGDYFYTGIKNRIDARRYTHSTLSRILQPALLVILLAVGIRFGVWVGSQVESSAPQSEQVALLPFDDIAEEPIEEFLLNLK